MISIGIDIGSFSIKVVEVKPSTTNDYEILSVEEFPLHQDSQKNQDLEIIDTLRQWILNRYSNQKQIRFVLTLKQNQFSYRTLTFPFHQRYKIEKAVPFSLEDLIPFPQKNIIYATKITRSSDSLSEVLTIVSLKRHIEERIEFFKKLHANPDILSLEEIGLFTPFELEEKKNISQSISQPEVEPKIEEENFKPSLHVLLNIGHKKTLIVIMKESSIMKLHSIDWGGEHLILALSKEHNIGTNEALRELQDQGFILANLKGATQKQIKTSEAIRRSVLSFSNKLYTLLSKIKEDPNRSYQSITLTGGSALIRNIETQIEKQTGIKTKRADDHFFSDHLNHSGLNSSSNLSMTSFIALGLALEGLKKPKNPPLNLLKDEFEKKNENFHIFMKKWSNLIKITAVFFAVFFLYSIFRDHFTSAISDKSYSFMREKASKIARLKGSNITARNAKKFIKKEKQKEKGGKIIKKLLKLNSPLDVLKKISEELPKRKDLPISIETFIVDSENVSMIGNSSKKSAIQSLQETLKKISKDNKVENLAAPKKETPDIKTPDTKTYSFAMKIKINQSYK